MILKLSNYSKEMQGFLRAFAKTKKLEVRNSVAIYLASTMFLYCLFYLTDIELMISPAIIFGLLSLVSLLDYWFFVKIVNKGDYGSTESEILEIAKFKKKYKKKMAKKRKKLLKK